VNSTNSRISPDARFQARTPAAPRVRKRSGGPGRIRTYDQGIHVAPMFPSGVDYLFTPGPSTGRVRDARRLSSRALQPSGSLCTFRRCTAGLAQGCHQSRWKDSLNSSRSLHGFRREGTFFDESPALTAVLQAQRRGFYRSNPGRCHRDCRGRDRVQAVVPLRLPTVGHQPVGAHAFELAPLRRDIGMHRVQRRLEARVLTQRTVRRIRVEVVPPVHQP